MIFENSVKVRMIHLRISVVVNAAEIKIKIKACSEKKNSSFPDFLSDKICSVDVVMTPRFKLWDPLP